ncbi:hypothetical protein [Catenulispora rubra]|nr:hypothetical protein [Catenulispora rubra]
MDGKNAQAGRRSNRIRRFDRVGWRLITKATMVSTLIGPVPLIMHR